jgi:hypothetical protein
MHSKTDFLTKNSLQKLEVKKITWSTFYRSFYFLVISGIKCWPRNALEAKTGSNISCRIQNRVRIRVWIRNNLENWIQIRKKSIRIHNTDNKAEISKQKIQRFYLANISSSNFIMFLKMFPIRVPCFFEYTESVEVL